MDEAELSRALRRATDDVAVPRDLLRHAERLGRERRARRRSVASALAVSVVVLTGGALVVTQGGGSESASSTSGGSADSAAGGSESSAAGGSEAAPAPAPSALEDRGPTSTYRQEAAPEAAAPQSRAGTAACLPTLTVDGVPPGQVVPVRAGERVEVVGSASPCGEVPARTRYVITLADADAPAGATTLTEVVPDVDGSFETRATVRITTPTGPAVLAVRTEADGEECRSAADCRSAVDLDVQPGTPSTRPAQEEPP